MCTAVFQQQGETFNVKCQSRQSKVKYFCFGVFIKFYLTFTHQVSQ